MQINRKTRNITKYLNHLQPSELYVLGLSWSAEVEQRLQSMDFNGPFAPGLRLLLPANKGAACRRNAEGYNIIHRDQPMEIAYRQGEWHWTQFIG